MSTDIEIGLGLFVAVSAIQLALGGLFGWLMRGGKHSRPVANTNTNADATPTTATAAPPVNEEMMQRMQALASSIGQNVGQHASRVESISQELVHAKDLGTDAMQAAVTAAVSKIAEANERLQGQLRSAEQKLEEQAEALQSQMTEARTDALTMIANRRAFDSELNTRLEEHQKQGTPTTLLMMDVDHFKKFNDTHGHLAGDETLRQVARVLYDTARGVDLVARYGGEEFAIVMPNTLLGDARRLAEKVRAAVAAHSFEFEGKTLRVTMSCGLSTVQDQDTPSSLVKRADEALYTSKQAGRNCIHLHDGVKCEPVAGAPKPAPRSAESTETVPAATTVPQPAPAEPATKPAKEVAATRNDPLTGLPNREAFCEDLKRRLAQLKRSKVAVATLMCDVDNLATVNEKFGPKMGDIVLRAVTQFLTAAMREMDLVCRYEGDRFSVLMPITDLPAAGDTAERIRKAISLCKLKVGDAQLQFTISTGVAEALPTDDVDTVLARCEEALQAAKAAGRDCTMMNDGVRMERAISKDADTPATVAVN